jgi:hypothetical protein
MPRTITKTAPTIDADQLGVIAAAVAQVLAAQGAPEPTGKTKTAPKTTSKTTSRKTTSKTKTTDYTPKNPNEPISGRQLGKLWAVLKDAGLDYDQVVKVSVTIDGKTYKTKGQMASLIGSMV